MLIVFEGIDGSGKTSLARSVAERLPALLLCEPCKRLHTPGKFVRDRLAAPPPHWTPEAWVCAMITGMLEQDVIARGALERGEHVVYDRREMSTRVYQGHAIDKLFGFPDMAELAARAVDEFVGQNGDDDFDAASARLDRMLQPVRRSRVLSAFVMDAARSLAPVDLLVWLDCPLEVAAQRRATRGAQDQEAYSDIETAACLHARYAREFDCWPGKKLRLDAQEEVEVLTDAVMRASAELV